MQLFALFAFLTLGTLCTIIKFKKFDFHNHGTRCNAEATIILEATSTEAQLDVAPSGCWWRRTDEFRHSDCMAEGSGSSRRGHSCAPPWSSLRRRRMRYTQARHTPSSLSIHPSVCHTVKSFTYHQMFCTKCLHQFSSSHTEMPSRNSGHTSNLQWLQRTTEYSKIRYSKRSNVLRYYNTFCRFIYFRL